MPLSVRPIDSDDGDVRELRLALVCYGGVSLAIYMHGITRELQSLVRASNAYDADQVSNPFDPATETAYAYWNALAAKRRADQEVRTRVVVDVIAGTSAGGINGVVLAKALACDASQAALRDVWLTQGDIGVLLANPVARRLPGLKAKAVATALGVALDDSHAPLSGRLLLTQVHGALQTMRNGNGGDQGGGGGWPIELHVTMTDFYGYALSAPAWDPKTVKDLRHRHVMSFRSERAQFGAEYDRALAFAARATSSFPGAFPPVRIADIESDLGGGWQGLDEFLKQFWASYTVSGQDARHSAFVDGGVLDNAPFGLAIDGVRRRPANVEVDRRLLFIQPDPADPKVPAEARPPGVVQTVWGGLSKIPRAEPVLDDLLDVRALNERIARADEVMAAVEADARGDANEAPGVDRLADANEQAYRDADDRLGLAVVTYRRLKVYSVIDRLAELAASIVNLPAESNQAFLVRDVLVEWAERGGLLSTAPEDWERVQLPFLRAFDLGYAERRLRFVVRRLNALYKDEQPGRVALNSLKRALYDRVYELTRVGQDAAHDEAAARLGEVFSPDALASYLQRPDDPKKVVDDFVDNHGRSLDELRDALSAYLSRRLGAFSEDSYKALLVGTEGWPPAPRAQLLSGYLRFPVWDALLFPIRVFGDVGERDKVEVLRVSPLDVDLLGVPGTSQRPPPAHKKLKGVAAGHFGAFFARDRRENDYLWGRLDGVERLVWLLVGDAPSAAYRQGFAAVLESERRDGALTSIRDLVADLESQVAALGDGAASGAGRTPAEIGS